MAVSIAIIEIKLIPIAVLKDNFKDIPARNKIMVSSNILVIKPLTIASIIMASVGQGIWKYWKYAMVPKSPMAQPSKHQNVFFALVRQIWMFRQKSKLPAEITATSDINYQLFGNYWGTLNSVLHTRSRNCL
eukprot:UN28176